MFNNPFDSFHNTVAEAKEERERLDRLLTISTPRERLLVAFIALLLSILLGWLFFGNVARSLALDGVLVGSPANPFGVNGSVQALVWVRSDVAPHIEAGMPAVIEFAMNDGEAGVLDGQVAAIAAVPASEEIAVLDTAPPVSAHRLDIAIDAGLELGPIAGSQCRVVIEIGSQPPVALFGMRRS